LLDLLRESGAGLRRGINAELLTRQKDLLERLNAKVDHQRRLLSRTSKSTETDRLAAEVHQVTSELEDVENEIRRKSPRWGALTHPQPLNAAAIQDLLDPETLLLEYAMGEDQSFLWAVTKDGIEGFELPSRQVIEAAAQEVYEGYRINDPRSRPATARAAARLSELVLAPVAHRLATQRLAIVADGALHYIPFAALPHPLRHPGSVPQPLLMRHEVISLPSASALGVQRQILAGRLPAARGLAILADPIFSAQDPRITKRSRSGLPELTQDDRLRDSQLERLAWSRWEAEVIAEHAGPGQATLALGFDANLGAIDRGFLGGHRIVHFATHGIIDSEHPGLTALVLSLRDAEGHPQRGFLRLPEIYNLEIDADLVVLSGCRTALGSEIRGEGLIGLTQGFFAAGARRLMASLWRVQDRSTAELMDLFYHRLLRGPASQRKSPAAALREAQLELMAEPGFEDPYHWAAFAVYGDWL
jgi:CHAT domain-containing protein